MITTLLTIILAPIICILLLIVWNLCKTFLFLLDDIFTLEWWKD